MKDDLIRRGELETVVEKMLLGITEPYDLIKTILDVPAVDAVEVVRCKDCKHWKPSDAEIGDLFENMEPIGGCRYVNFCRKASDFCSYGERWSNNGEIQKETR